MSIVLGAALLGGASTGYGIYSANRERKRQKKTQQLRSDFFDSEISPLLGEMEQDIGDVDFNAIRQAELNLPAQELQSQIRGLGKRRETALSGSGFAGSGFIEDDYSNDFNLAQTGFKDTRFRTDRGIMDMQSQLESMINENRLRAKELEFSYKYG